MRRMSGAASYLLGASVLVTSLSACGSSGGAATTTGPPVTLTVPAVFTIPLATVPLGTAPLGPGSSTTVGGSTVAASAVPTVGPTTVSTSSSTGGDETIPGTTRAPITANWQSATNGIAGLPSECGNLSLLSVRPDSDTLIASVALQGLWTSTDGTDTWTQLGTGAGSATITNRGSTLVYDPEHPATMWESGLYNGLGIYRTDDNGQTWRELGPLKSVEAVSVDLTDPSRKTMLASLHERTALYRSTDAGASWTDITASLPAGVGYTASPVVVNSQTLLLGTRHGDSSGVFRSTDGGTTWTNVYSGGVVGLPVSSSTDQSMYWLLDQSQGIIRSTDGGSSWTLVTAPGVVSPLVSTLAVLPDGRLATIGNNIVIMSSDHGVTWRSVGPAIPISPAGLVYSPSRKSLYAWHFDCATGDNPVQTNSIVRLAFDPSTN